MAISSMTGFARHQGTHLGWCWQWDLRSVNGKALDARLKLPSGMEHLEFDVRGGLAQKFKRGNFQVSLSLDAADGAELVQVDQKVLDSLVGIAEDLRQRVGGGPLQVEQLLGLRGVLVQSTPEASPEQEAARDVAIMHDFHRVVALLAVARQSEGKILHAILSASVNQIESLTVAAKQDASRTPERIQARLSEQIERAMGSIGGLDPQRLHQEAMLLAMRNDIQEEVDRLLAHVSAARELLSSGEPIGRKLDFLLQEFNREANTLCSKSSDITITRIGLELKHVIDQLREQVQNVE